MEQVRLENIVTELTENNKKLLKHVLEPMLDEMAFSEPNIVYIKHGGVVSEYSEYEKALSLLKKCGVINDFNNVRSRKPITDKSVHVTDEFEITYDEASLQEFADLLIRPNGSKGPTSHAHAKYVGAIDYDDEHAVITFNGKSATLFSPEIMEAFLFGKVHKADGARLNSIHLVEQYEDKHRDEDILINNKALTNAKDRINGKFAAEFGADNIVMYERSQFWLNHSFISESSPYRTE